MTTNRGGPESTPLNRVTTRMFTVDVQAPDDRTVQGYYPRGPQSDYTAYRAAELGQYLGNVEYGRLFTATLYAANRRTDYATAYFIAEEVVRHFYDIRDRENVPSFREYRVDSVVVRDSNDTLGYRPEGGAFFRVEVSMRRVRRVVDVELYPQFIDYASGPDRTVVNIARSQGLLFTDDEIAAMRASLERNLTPASRAKELTVQTTSASIEVHSQKRRLKLRRKPKPEGTE